MIQEVLGHAVRPRQKKHHVWVKSLISFYLNQLDEVAWNITKSTSPKMLCENRHPKMYFHLEKRWKFRQTAEFPQEFVFHPLTPWSTRTLPVPVRYEADMVETSPESKVVAMEHAHV